MRDAGWLDALVLSGSRFGDPSPAGTNRLYKNNRDGTFTDVTERSGLFHTGYSFGVTVGDQLVLPTARGKTKRVKMQEFAAVRPSGLIAMSLDKGDQLSWARLTSGKDEVIFVTA